MPVSRRERGKATNTALKQSRNLSKGNKTTRKGKKVADRETIDALDRAFSFLVSFFSQIWAPHPLRGGLGHLPPPLPPNLCILSRTTLTLSIGSSHRSHTTFLPVDRTELNTTATEVGFVCSRCGRARLSSRVYSNDIVT